MTLAHAMVRLVITAAVGSLAPGSGGTAASWVQPSGAAASPGTVFVIHLEQKKGDQTVATVPGHVFDSGDVVRFRVTAKGVGGYLYVIDLGTSGAYSTLFPASNSRSGAGGGDASLLKPDQDAFVPAVEDGWFQVDGPPGFDVLYFLVSPGPLDVVSGSADKGTANAPLPDSLKPRCNDAIFQARGECVDESAGPSALARDMPIPPQFSNAASSASRDIVLDEGAEDHSVKTTSPPGKPAVYVFRLAHR